MVVFDGASECFFQGDLLSQVLDFIIGIEENHGLMDIEMPWFYRVHDRECQKWRVHSECDE
jgi:hypothetical protein